MEGQGALFGGEPAPRQGPDALLAAIRRECDGNHTPLAVLVNALDRHLTCGGPPPAAWDWRDDDEPYPPMDTLYLPGDAPGPPPGA